MNQLFTLPAQDKARTDVRGVIPAFREESMVTGCRARALRVPTTRMEAMDFKPNRPMTVLVCDDDHAVREDLRACLLEYARLHGVNIEVAGFESAEALLEASEPFDALFLDIFLDGMDGTEAAWRLSEDERRRTVFLTTSHDHAIEAYQIGAAHYLVKPVSPENVAEALDRCIRADEDVRNSGQVMTVRTTDGIVPISMDSIRMIEARDKVCVISASNRDWRSYTSLNALEEQLDGRRFVRVHRSYVVNMHRIKTLYHDRVVMDDGTTIGLSRGRRQEIRQAYQDFMFALARGKLS